MNLASARDEGSSVLTISLEMPPSMAALGGADTAAAAGIGQALEVRVADLMRTFGVPGNVRVHVSARPETSEDDARVRVHVDDRPARYPDHVLVHAYSYVNDRLLDADANPATIADWLRAAEPEMVVDFLAGCCHEIVSRQPEILLGDAQITEYISLLDQLADDPASSIPDQKRLGPILQDVLGCGISIANTTAVAEIVAQNTESAAHSLREELIDALRGKTVEIHVTAAYLQHLTATWEQLAPTMFPFLRDGMFAELGLAFPDLRFVVADDLKEHCFAFKVNEIRSAPVRSLNADQCLVNDTAERLRLHGLEASRTLNPATSQPSSVIARSDETAAAAQGLTTWNQLQYMVLCLAEFLRQNGWRTVHRNGARRLLAALDPVFPHLVEAVRHDFSDDEMAALLRVLIRERVSVRNLRAILEALVDFRLNRARSPEGQWDGYPTIDELLASVRIALGREIAHKASRHSSTVVVYLLDPALELMAANRSGVDAGDGDRILTALRTEMAHLPPTAQVPNVLTFADSRAALQRLIATEHPGVMVLAHEELPPDVNVMPVARVA